MNRYFAFLRAINVGGRYVKMDQLRTLFEELDLENVSTFIASGNVVFESNARSTRALERRIEAQLKRALGYDVETFVRSAAELAAVARHDPFPSERPLPSSVSLIVGFMREPVSATQEQAIASLRTAADELHVHGRELYWLARQGLGKTLVQTNVLGRATGPMTTRNIKTVRRILAKHETT